MLNLSNGHASTISGRRDTTTWNHELCVSCWIEREGHRLPVRLVPAVWERCCFCGTWNNSGIWIRHDPRTLSCVHWEGGD